MTDNSADKRCACGLRHKLHGRSKRWANHECWKRGQKAMAASPGPDVKPRKRAKRAKRSHHKK